MDPATAAILGGSNIVGGILAGNNSSKANSLSTNLEQMLGMRGLDVQSASVGDQMLRQMESMPLRDRILAQLQARMGQSPASFNPAGMWGNKGQGASTGGIDQGAMQQAAANYTPGSGGTRPDIMSQFMNRLGYKPEGGGTGNPWQQALTQKFSSPSTAWADMSVNPKYGSLEGPPNAVPYGRTTGIGTSDTGRIGARTPSYQQGGISPQQQAMMGAARKGAAQKGGLLGDVFNQLAVKLGQGGNA